MKPSKRPCSQRVAKNVLRSINEKRGYADEIEKLIDKPVSIPNNKNVSASIGIAIAQNVKTQDDLSVALKQADSTLYQIKHTTKGDFKLA